MSIGNRIIKVRMSKKLTQTELAKLIGITSQSLVRYEKDKVKTSTELLKKLCDKIKNLNGHWLITGNGNMFLNIGLVENNHEMLEVLIEKTTEKNIEWINIVGDSMEPTFRNEDIILIDKSQTDIINDGIYGFKTKHGLFIKRIQKRIDGQLNILSDNKEYAVQTVNINEIKIIGKIVSFIRNTIL